MLTDPYLILGLNRKPTDEDVRKAYLKAIRICPPEKDSETFHRIQVAYDEIKTQRLRLAKKMFNYQLPSPEDFIMEAVSKSPTSSVRPSLAAFKALLH